MINMPLSKPIIIFLVALIVLGTGVYLFQKGYFHKKQTTFDPPYPEVNTNEDPILAVFEGRIPYTGPCDVCEKIKISLVLYQDKETKKPSTYWLGQVVVGEGNDRIVTQGSWILRRGIKGYPSAEVYMLDENTPEELRMYWRVNEDILLPLDKNMAPKVGNSAWGYMLSRYKEPYGPRTY